MAIINKNRQIQPERTDLVPDLKEFHFYQGEMEKLKKLCSLIPQEEKKEAEAAAADTATAKAAAVEKQNANEKAQALKNYVLIRSVGIAEGVLTSMAAYLIDKFKISMKSFKKEEESETDSWEDDVVKIHLDQHEKIKNYTVGKIIASQKKLGNARKIGDTFQAINAIKRKDNAGNHHPFFDWLQDLSRSEKSEQDLFIELIKMLRKRNQTTHNLRDVDDSADELEEQISHLQGLTHVIWYASWINLSRWSHDYTNTWQKQDANQCGVIFKGLTLKSFYDITAKHIKN